MNLIGDTKLVIEEISFAVKEISISNKLPQAPDLVFVNITLLEGQFSIYSQNLIGIFIHSHTPKFLGIVQYLSFIIWVSSQVHFLLKAASES